MKQKSILTASAILVPIGAIFLNFNKFLMGSPAGWQEILTTFLYLLFWVLFLIYSKNNRGTLLYSVVWNGFTLMCGVIILIVNAAPHLMLTWAIPFLMIFITPLYGLTILLPGPSSFYLGMVCVAISLTGMITSLVLLKKQKN